MLINTTDIRWNVILLFMSDWNSFVACLTVNFGIFNRPTNNRNLTQLIQGFWSFTTRWLGWQLVKLVRAVRRQSSSLKPSSSPSCSSGHNSWRLFQKTFEGFDCKFNGQALGAALQHSWGGSDWQTTTQSASKSAVVGAGSNRLTLGRFATTLWYWVSSIILQESFFLWCFESLGYCKWCYFFTYWKLNN